VETLNGDGGEQPVGAATGAKVYSFWGEGGDRGTVGVGLSKQLNLKYPMYVP
jgi:hypothetical protein